MLSQMFNLSGSLVCFLDLPLSLAFLALFRSCATTKYNFVMSSMLIMLSSVPMYLGLSDARRVCFTFASCPNIRKNGAMPGESVGKKLYTDVALNTRSSHSNLFSSCFEMNAFKNWWNPSILPLHCGE